MFEQGSGWLITAFIMTWERVGVLNKTEKIDLTILKIGTSVCQKMP